MPWSRADGESIFVANTWLLHEYDAATGKLRRKVDNLGPNTVALDGENLVLSSWFSNAVWVWNPQTQKVLEEYYDFNMPLNAVRFQGDLVVAELGTSSVVRASAADPTQRTTLAKDLGVPAGLVASKGELWVSDRATGKVWQLAAGGKVLAEPKLTASGLDRPEGMALTPDGRLLVAETGTGRLRGHRSGDRRIEHHCRGAGIQPASTRRGSSYHADEQCSGQPIRRALRDGRPRQRGLSHRARQVAEPQAPVTLAR